MTFRKHIKTEYIKEYNKNTYGAHQKSYVFSASGMVRNDKLLKIME